MGEIKLNFVEIFSPALFKSILVQIEFLCLSWKWTRLTQQNDSEQLYLVGVSLKENILISASFNTKKYHLSKALFSTKKIV